MAEGVWRASYEQLRAAVVAGGQPDGVDARRLARFGLAGLAAGRPAWRVAVTEAPEPRWSGGDPALDALVSAYSLMTTGGGTS